MADTNFGRIGKTEVTRSDDSTPPAKECGRLEASPKGIEGDWITDPDDTEYEEVPMKPRITPIEVFRRNLSSALQI